MNRLKKIANYLLGYIPQELPRSGTDFEKFVTSIFETYGIPDMPSYRQAIASMIMHLGPQAHKKSKAFFVVSVKKAMANQIAYDAIDAIRRAEKEVKADEPKPSEDAIPG